MKLLVYKMPNHPCVNVDECPICKELVRGDNDDFSRVNSNDCATRQ